MAHVISCTDMAAKLGCSLHEVQLGLWPAVQEFLSAQSEWRLARRYTHNHGLTVLERQFLSPTLQCKKCSLDLIRFRSPSEQPPWYLVPPRISEQHEYLTEEVHRKRTPWALVRLGILLGFFVASVRSPGDIQARDNSMALARTHLA